MIGVIFSHIIQLGICKKKWLHLRIFNCILLYFFFFEPNFILFLLFVIIKTIIEQKKVSCLNFKFYFI